MISMLEYDFDGLFDLVLLGINMDTDKIKKRNEEYLQDFFQRYKLNLKIEDLDLSADSKAPDKITSIYINFKEWSFQVYGNRRLIEYIETENGAKTKVKMKKVLIYNFSTRKINQLKTQEEIYQVRADFIRFVLMFNELKKIAELQKEESQIRIADEAAKESMLTNLR